MIRRYWLFATTMPMPQPLELPYQAIIFDLDDTLYDYTAYWHERLHWSLAEVVQQCPWVDLAAVCQQAIERRVYAAHLDGLLQEWNVTDAALRARAIDRYRENWYERLDLFAGVAAMLDRLAQRAQLALITNGPAHSQRPKIARFALERWMQCILVSGEVGIAKPDPRIFARALAELGVAAEQAVYVGDSLEYDLQGAAAAGVDFVWLNRSGAALPPDAPVLRAIIAQIGELEQVLERLSAAS